MTREETSGGCCSSGCNCNCSCLRKVSGFIETNLEAFFEKLGRTVGKHPGWTIGLSLAFAALCLAGMVRFRQESRNDKLWVPSGADSIDHKVWVEENFPETTRALLIIVEAKANGNVLDRTILRQIYDLHVKIIDVASPDSDFYKEHGQTYTDFCNTQISGRCFFSSLLALWKFNKTVIDGLTLVDVQTQINDPNLQDPWNERDANITRWIGGIERNEAGYITKATALSIGYFITANETLNERTGELIDERSSDFESAAQDVVLKENDLFNGYAFSESGFTEEAGKSIQNDLLLLAAGYAVIIFYVCISLGECNALHQKAWLSFAGILSAGLGIGASFGLCSAFGLFYGPVHSVLPFLLIGIGVDDMFVIVAAWENLSAKDRKLDVSERTAKALKKAGVSVTVTSFTDLVAFLVGSTTVLPALRSFCVYAGIGIFLDFVFQVTFFLAFLAIDAYRADKKRDACCCILLPSNYEPSECCWPRWPFKSGWLKKFIGGSYARLLTKWPMKVFVILATCGLFGASVYGVTELKREFDFRWFLPSNSYVLDYFDAQEKYFPSSGVATAAYTGNVEYFEERDMLVQLEDKMKNDPYIDSFSVSSWYAAYQEWKNRTVATSSEDFYADVRRFLVSSGRSYAKDVVFDNNDKIIATRIPAGHIRLDSTTEEVDAMVSIRESVDSVILTPDKPFAYSELYLNWEGNLVIRRELFRNLGLALLCVFIVTLLLLADLWGSILVLICVTLTLVDVAGLMHFWGLTVDTVTTVVLVLAIGLAVDYSAHITHTFLIPNAEAKTRDERMIHTLHVIGAAVWNGGFSTFLAFVLLAGSGSYVFTTFFKVFFLVVVCGLFHSLGFLPVILSLVGPAPYEYTSRRSEPENDISLEKFDGKEKEADLSTPPPSHSQSPGSGDVTSEVPC